MIQDPTPQVERNWKSVDSPKIAYNAKQEQHYKQVRHRLFSRSDSSQLSDWWWSIDRYLLGATFCLIILSLLFSMSTSPTASARFDLNSWNLFAQRHSTFLCLAILALILSSLFKLELMIKLTFLGGIITLGLLFALLFSDQSVQGATRWIAFGSLPPIQPSEFYKPAFVVFVAWLLAGERDPKAHLPGTLLVLLLYVLTCFLLLSQPDVGQFLLITITLMTLFFLAGLSWRAVFVSLGALFTLSLVIYFLFPHVQNRISSFLESSFQTTQALRAFNAGGLLGVGPGEGIVKWSLPDVHSDFIFAAIAEEYGLLTCFLVLSLYVFICIRAFRKITRLSNYFHALAASGLLMTFLLQVFINLASSLALIPTKGMTLPFLSYGGSSLVACGITIGLLLNFLRLRTTP